MYGCIAGAALFAGFSLMAAIAVVLHIVRHAPLGTEDETGFHIIREDDV